MVQALVRRLHHHEEGLPAGRRRVVLDKLAEAGVLGRVEGQDDLPVNLQDDLSGGDSWDWREISSSLGQGFCFYEMACSAKIPSMSGISRVNYSRVETLSSAWKLSFCFWNSCFSLERCVPKHVYVLN